MGYIRFVLSSRTVTADGKTTAAVISRIESDMAGARQLDTNLILHALSAPCAMNVENLIFVLDKGLLDTNILQ